MSHYLGMYTLLGASGTLNGVDCYILGVKVGLAQVSIQYFRMSDGVLLQKAPGIDILGYLNRV